MSEIKFDNVKQLQEAFADLLVDAAKKGALEATKDLGTQAPPPAETRTDSGTKGTFADVLKTITYKSTGGRFGAPVLKDIYEADDSSGGFAVPSVYADEIFTIAAGSNPVRPYARVFRIKGNELIVPSVDVDTMSGPTALYGGVTMQKVADGSAPTEGQPAFKQVRFPLYTYRGVTQVSKEWLNESVGNGAAMVNQMFAEATGFCEGYYCFAGTGTNEPEGLTNCGAAKSVARGTASTFVDADAFKMVAALTPGWQPSNTAWFVTIGAAGQLLSLSDKERYLKDPRTAVNAANLIGSLMGLPVHITVYQPALNTQGDVQLVDCSKYVIAEGSSISLAASDQFAFTSGLITYRYEVRFNAGGVIPTTVTWPNSQTTSWLVQLGS